MQVPATKLGSHVSSFSAEINKGQQNILLLAVLHGWKKVSVWNRTLTWQES